MFKKTITTFVPFEHSNLTFIQGMLNFARGLKTDTPDGVFTSSLIYINAVDYIATHLLENLNRIETLVLQREMKSIIFPTRTDSINQPLGRLIGMLKDYEFPDKKDFIHDLEAFKNTRDMVAHRLMTLSTDDVDKIDDRLGEFRETAERLFNRYDSIVNGITLSWSSYVGAMTPKETVDKRPEGIVEDEAVDDDPVEKPARRKEK